MVNSLSYYKEILILKTLKKVKKFQNIIGINTAVIILVFLNTLVLWKVSNDLYAMLQC